MIASVAAANRSGVHTGFEPQSMPFSTWVSYVTRVVPVPTTPVPPGETANAPEPRSGTPSAGRPAGPAGGSEPPPSTAGATGRNFAVTSTFGVARDLGITTGGRAALVTAGTAAVAGPAPVVRRDADVAHPLRATSTTPVRQIHRRTRSPPLRR